MPTFVQQWIAPDIGRRKLALWTVQPARLLVHAVGITKEFSRETFTNVYGIRASSVGSTSGRLHMNQLLVGALGIAIIASAYCINERLGHSVSGLSSAFLTMASIAHFFALIAVFAFSDKQSDDRITGEKTMNLAADSTMQWLMSKRHP